MRRRWHWGGGAVAVAVAALVAAVALRAPQVDSFVVQTAPLVRTLQFSARVASLSRVNVGSTLTGRVAKVNVDEGAQVKQGDVLVQLETGELQAAVAQARAAERQAEARLAGLRSTGRTSANAALLQAQSTLRAAEAELARTQKLVTQGFLSEARLDEARRAVEVARAQQTGALAQTRANEESGTDVAQAQAQLAQTRAATAAARQRLAQAAVLAPTDARVLARHVEPGQIAQPGTSLMSLALAGPTQLVAQVDERFLDQLRVGQKAMVVADAFAGQPFAARVLTIGPAVDAQRGAVEVKLALVQQGPAFLREDMTLSVEVETAQRERALVLPLRALRAGTGADAGSVLVAQDGRAHDRAVRLGLRTLDAVEVLDGVRQGESVLVGGELRDGSRVRPRVVAWTPGSAPPPAGREDAASALTNAVAR